ncbi:MAG: UDP-N-acetylmuramoyl-L-alanine--D-glutamate ligase [Oscillospiraceae bacterium]|jgi:UDP-N-acetylmuramoylalanine--D-glutamate ligase|nr:UDP-N-acetylmuramoyl-L-alanine--D-glutamate ligase [Oscillospiraceae bacterium]
MGEILRLTEFIESLRGKKIAVVGVGISNMPLLRLLIDNGLDVSARDKNVVEIPGLERSKFGEGYLDCSGEDVVFRSPGVKPWELTLKDGAVLTSEMEAFFDICPCPIIGVTGSDGKTTTATLIAELLKAEGKTVRLGGNIGKPLLAEVQNIAPEDYAVAELSSFQLITMKKSPRIAVLTNITPNHLDWHRSFDEYASAKTNIFRFQKPGDRLVFDANSVSGLELKKVLSEHNRRHFATAIAALDGIVGADAVRQVADNFSGVEHRLEFVREFNGVRFYNDSIASSPDRTIAGLEAFDKKVILIAGGKDKGVPFDALGPVISERVKALVLTGPTAEPIFNAVRDCGCAAPSVQVIDDFDEAVLTAAGLAKPGDIVLLSPASTSFDRFKNFEERGRHFKEIVKSKL